MRIEIETVDNKIWNEDQAFVDIAHAMNLNKPLTIDFLHEGIDLHSSGFFTKLHNIADIFQYPISNITVFSANALEHHDLIKVKYQPPMHLVENAKTCHVDIVKDTDFVHFGIFINRSNAERLYLASYLYDNFLSKLKISYHFNMEDVFHTNNVGLEDLIRNYNIQDVTVASNFLKQCPLRLDNNRTVQIEKNSVDNPSQQLLSRDRDTFIENYQKYFLEVVCESYYTGNTFFPTEKTWRPILLKTPFIVQGAQWYLHRLRDMGFQTFDRWWDEGYAEDPADYQMYEIVKVIEDLAKKSTKDLYAMYQEMKTVLEHNYKRFLELDRSDFEKLVKQ